MAAMTGERNAIRNSRLAGGFSAHSPDWGRPPWGPVPDALGCPTNIGPVETEDALLVIDRNRAQDVRKIVEQLKKLRRTELS
jgi:Mannose-6-phosphate isomerase